MTLQGLVDYHEKELDDKRRNSLVPAKSHSVNRAAEALEAAREAVERERKLRSFVALKDWDSSAPCGGCRRPIMSDDWYFYTKASDSTRCMSCGGSDEDLCVPQDRRKVFAYEKALDEFFAIPSPVTNSALSEVRGEESEG